MLCYLNYTTRCFTMSARRVRRAQPREACPQWPIHDGRHRGPPYYYHYYYHHYYYYYYYYYHYHYHYHYHYYYCPPLADPRQKTSGANIRRKDTCSRRKDKCSRRTFNNSVKVQRRSGSYFAHRAETSLPRHQIALG